MTTDPEPFEATETPEVEAPPAVVEETVAPPPAPPARRVNRFFDTGRSRIGLFVAAAVLIFAGGFVAGHWVFERHDHDHHRPEISARAQRFLQGLQGERGGKQGNNSQMDRNLQQLLPFLEQLLNNRGNGNGNGNGGSNAVPNDVQRQLQQLRQQLQQLQDQLKTTPTPATPR